MKTNIVAVIGFIILTSFAFAQYEEYDLASFKTPDYERHQLWGSIRGDNSSRRQNDVLYDYFNNSNNSGLNGDIRYYWIKSTRDFQRYIDIDLSFNGYYLNEDNSNYNKLHTDFSNTVNFEKMDRRFFQNGSFFETTISIDNRIRKYYWFGQYLIVAPPSKDNFQYDDLTLFLPIKYGQGRIEQVDDARRAIYILQALDKAGRIAVDVQDRDIADLANLVTELRNRRVYDYRLSTMEKLEDLDAFLRSRSLVTQTDARYFVTLDDMWRYNNVGNRSSGSSYAIAFRPGINLNYTKDIEEDLYQNELHSVIDMGVEYVKETPLNLYWQESVKANFYIVYNNLARYRQVDSQIYCSQYMNFNMSMERRYTYYPNTRTEMIFRLGATYANGIVRFGDSPESLLADSQLIHGLAGVDIAYYITPKLSFTLRSSLEYMWTGKLYIRAIPADRTIWNYNTNLSVNREGHQLYSMFNVSIDYSIF